MKKTMDRAKYHESFYQGLAELARTRRRRLRIGDLMVGVAIAAIGLSALGQSDLTAGEKQFFVVASLVLLVLQWAQWQLASVSIKESQTAKATMVGTLSSLLALLMFVLLIVLGLVFPRGAALESVMILIQVVFMTTWD